MHWRHPAAILEVKPMLKQEKHADLNAQCTGLTNEQPPFDLWLRTLYQNDIKCIRFIVWTKF